MDENMWLNRIRTLFAYFVGALFCVWATVFCRSFRIRGPLRCYGWPYLRSADGELHIGRGVILGNVKIILANGGRLTLGNRVSINDGSVLGVLSGIDVGENTSISENVMIRDHDHDYSKARIGERAVNRYIIRNVTIGQGCWLGFGCMILKGVVIDDGVVTGAGTVVTKNLVRGSIVVGNSARVISIREDIG